MEELKYHYQYPHPCVTTDCVIFGFDGTKLNVLLIERGIDPFKGRWAFPGGFLKMDETALQGAKRELYEETGLKDAYIHQFHAFSGVDRDPRERVITVAHYALVKLAEVEAATDADKAEWFSRKDIPHLAFDHDQILRVAFSRLKQDIHFQPVGFELLPDTFTLPQLQNLYESILEVKFDRRNFANKMKHYEILTEVADETPRHGTRTPVKYSFDKENYDRLKSNGFQLEF